MASLLLRLFHSDYFSPHLALSYLRTYSDNIGITYYLVYRLKTSFPPEQVDFYWPQLCHLLITKPSESRALECFVLERCQESVHVALLTLWNLQAALFDLSTSPHTPSFKVCKRVYNECQRILFDDPLSDSRIGRVVSSHGKQKEKISPWNTKCNIVGIGTVLASVPAMPSLAPFSGQVAIEQGRARPSGKQVEDLADGIARISTAEQQGDSDDDQNNDGQGHSGDEDDGGDDSDDNHSQGQSAPQHQHQHQQPTATPSILQKPSVNNDNPFANISAGFNQFNRKATAAVGEAFGQTFGVTFPNQANNTSSDKKAQKQRPAWHPQRSSTKRRTTAQHLSSEDSSAPTATHPNFRSAPNLNNINASRPSLTAPAGGPFASNAALSDTASSVSVEAVLSQYDAEARRRLLRSHYCRTQTQFLLELQDVSARLVQLPKPARLSALRAELTALNHKLPSEVCFPLWCSANSQPGSTGADTNNAIEAQHAVPGGDGESSVAPKGSKKKQQQQRQRQSHEQKHHRVVRINPSESVVLNSADRAPYMLHVEVLTDDLDFDPDRRSNRDSLKRLVLQEDVRRRKFQLTRSFGTGSEVSSRGELGSTAALGETSATSTAGRRGSASNEPGQEHHPLPSSSSSIPTISSFRPLERTFSASVPGKGRAESIQAQSSHSQSRPSSPMPLPDEGEEIDLTEQAYGSDLAAFGEERMQDSDEEDQHLSEINRDHDAAAWTQARHGGNGAANGSRHSRQGSLTGAASAADAQKRIFSLDEYSERMRTAAIMLAQLNQSTNASSQPVVTHNPHVTATAQGGWSSWIVGTSWASNVPSSKNEIGQGSAGIKAPIGAPSAPASGTMAESGRSSDRRNSENNQTTAAAAGSSSGGGASAGPSRLIHADTEAIRKRIMHEMMLLEEERMERMKSGSRKIGTRRPAPGVEDEATVLKAVNKDDPSAAMFKETWAAKKARIRAGSPYGHLPSWDVFSVIVKIGADLRQEQLAVQLINEFGRIWSDTGSRLWVRYFRILVTSENSGIMETVTDAISVHSIKKEAYARAQRESAGEDRGRIATYSIFDHFVNTYGEPSSAKFNRARDKFMESLAAYSIITYLLQIKDRHNGNILLSSDGRIIHIDFGFMLGISPGGVGFEAAPFKLTQEYIDILGGVGSPKFEEFKKMMRQGFKDVRKHAERIIMIVELMQKDSKLPCFALGPFTASNLRDRFALALSANQVDDFVDRLVLASCASSYTRLYDSFQYYSQGIL